MSFERYIELLQALLTMTNPDNEEEVLNARNILKNLLELSRSSQMADPLTLRAMTMAYHQFTVLLRHREDFAGKPGDIAANRAKRQRLAMMVRPGC